MKVNIKKIIFILLIAFLAFTTNVYAVNDSFSTTITANKSEIEREQTITITIGLSNISIESGEKGIGAYTGKINFDSSVLEYVCTSGTSKWDKPFYQNGLITATTTDGEVVKTTQNIGTITFKVKKDAKLGQTTISLENFSGSTVENDVLASNKSVNIKIIDTNIKDENNKNDKPNGGNGNTNSGSENNNSGNENINSGSENNNSVN